MEEHPEEGEKELQNPEDKPELSADQLNEEDVGQNIEKFSGMKSGLNNGHSASHSTNKVLNGILKTRDDVYDIESQMECSENGLVDMGLETDESSPEVIQPKRNLQSSTPGSDESRKFSSDLSLEKDGCETSTNETSPDLDEAKKDVDTSKAVTFAEDIEVYDMGDKTTTSIPISDQTPIHYVDSQTSSVFSSPETVRLDDVDIHKDVDAGQTEETEEQKAGNQVESEAKESHPARPSVLSLFKKSENSEKEKNLETSETKPLLENGDKEGTEDDARKEISEDDCTEHKEFQVMSVDESELITEPSDHEKTSDKDSPGQDVVCPLITRAPSSHSDGMSYSTDSNNQDTIGPLDNPTFLKTLHYSVSQPFDQDEHFGLQSNLDLRSLDALQDPPDLDKGWAWVVLCSSFVAATLLGATVYAAGVLMSGILKEIDPDLTKASWVGSVNVCVTCLSGPFVGAVLKRFGARVTVSCAGLVMTLGFIGASFSTTITQLILTHGLVAGLGGGYTINPLFVTVGQYFNRYRGLACGVLATGAGAGMLSGGAFISYLLETYGLSGTYLIWAGVIFHVTPVGFLLRPSPEERFRSLEKEYLIGESQQNIASQQDLVSGRISMFSGINSLYSSANQSMLSGMDKISHGRRSNWLRNSSKMSNGDPENPLLKAVLHHEMSRSSHSVATNRSFSKSHLSSPAPNKYVPSPGHGDIQYVSITGTTSPAVTPTPTSPVTVPSNSQLTLSNNLSSSPHHGNSHLLSTQTLTPSVLTPSYPPSSPTSNRGPLTQSRFQRSRLQSTGSQSQYTSMSHISRRLSLRGSLHASQTGDLDNESITSTLVSQLRPRDALAPRHPLGSRSISTFMGSMASFPTALAIVKDDLSRFGALSSGGSQKTSLKGFFIKFLDSLRLLRNKPFLIFISTCFLWALGESPVMIYLPSYAISRGTSPLQASSLYTAMGIGSMAGRLLCGLIATDNSIGPIILHMGCLGVAGVLVCISPLITGTVLQQMIFSSLLGIYTGSLVPLTSLITIEMLGIEELGLGFGFLSMAQGIGYLIGPPLASIVVQGIGYRNSFVCSGFVLLLGSFVAMSIALFLKNTDDDDDDDEHPMDELERALQRIADSDSEGDDGDTAAGDAQVEEESLKPFGGSLNTINEIKEESQRTQAKGSLVESSGEVTKNQEETAGGEDRLDTIMEVVGK